MPIFPGDPKFHLKTLFTVERDGFRLNWTGIGEHSGTHWGSPCHFNLGEACAEDLAAENLLLYSIDPDDSFVFREVFTPAGIVPARASFIMLTEAMIELARAGTGVGVLPRWSARRAIATGGVAALSITRRGMRRQWVAATLAAQEDPPYLTDFIDLLSERALPARAAVRDTA